MACHIASNNNRFYAAIESSYGTVAPVDANQRCPGLSLHAQQQTLVPRRIDKTGTRTYQGVSGALRRATAFTFKTYVTSGASAGQAPAHAPLYQAALGADPQAFTGVGVAGSTNGTMITTAGAHGLQPGQAVTLGGEIRFVAAVGDANTVVVNAPFTSAPGAGETLGATVSYGPASQLKSVSLHDYWTPETAVHRIVAGATVSRVRWKANGDFHEVEFDGPGTDLLDSASFESGQGGLSQFPAEPALGSLEGAPIPGFTGQIWIGSEPQQFLTLTDVEITLDNHIETRFREYGARTPRCIVPGEREVTASFRLYEQDNATYFGLYQAARQRTPISLFLQMGEEPGRLCGIWISRFMPEVPEYDDAETRLAWKFSTGRAEGSVNDEIFVAFG